MGQEPESVRASEGEILKGEGESGTGTTVMCSKLRGPVRSPAAKTVGPLTI